MTGKSISEVNTRLHDIMTKMPKEDLLAASEAVNEAIERDITLDELRSMESSARDFLQGMDSVATVLVTLVLKHGRVVNALKAVFVLSILGNILFIISIIAILDAGTQMDDIQRNQDMLYTRMMKTSDKADETLSRLQEVQEEAPKVVVDSAGNPALVVAKSKPVPELRAAETDKTKVVQVVSTAKKVKAIPMSVPSGVPSANKGPGELEKAVSFPLELSQ
jgi:hypothetical protein